MMRLNNSNTTLLWAASDSFPFILEQIQFRDTRNLFYAEAKEKKPYTDADVAALADALVRLARSHWFSRTRDSLQYLQ